MAKSNSPAIIGGAIIIAVTVAVCLVFPSLVKACLIGGAIALVVCRALDGIVRLIERTPDIVVQGIVFVLGIALATGMTMLGGCASTVEPAPSPSTPEAIWEAIWAELEEHACYGAIDQTMFVIGAPESYIGSETECEGGRGCAFAGWPEGDPIGRYTVATWDGLTPSEEAEEVEHQLRHVVARCLAHSGVEWAEEHPAEIFGW